MQYFQFRSPSLDQLKNFIARDRYQPLLEPIRLVCFQYNCRCRLLVKAGHEVMFSSRHPEELKAMVAELGERPSIGTPKEAAALGVILLLLSHTTQFRSWKSILRMLK